jgi:hypothetical protein
MNRERFEHLLAAYGADFRRWPEAERDAGAAFAAQNGDEARVALVDAAALDGALRALNEPAPDTSLLARRILKAAPRPWIDRRAAIALGACAVFGVLIGYGGGLLAPSPDIDDPYLDAAFEAPFFAEDEG